MDYNSNEIDISIKDLVPNYPNQFGSGISKSGNFAIRQLFTD